jgi:hypothetical protein
MPPIRFMTFNVRFDTALHGDVVSVAIVRDTAAGRLLCNRFPVVAGLVLRQAPT